MNNETELKASVESIYLTLDSKYVPSWGMKEGLRELVQNWLDAGGQGKPEHRDGKLVLDNPEATMSREALLIGFSSKRDVDGQRGQFGEGFKLGTLALLRDGCTITVRVPGEMWQAKLAQHPHLRQEVLAWDIVSAPEATGVRVEIDGITGEDWASMRRMFLWGSDITKSSVLLGEDHKHSIYVKGIFVMSEARLHFGYNLHDIKTDRDRKLVDNFQLSRAARDVLVKAVEDGTVSGADIVTIAEEDTLESDGFYGLYRHSLSPEVKQSVTDAWIAKYPDTIPVQEMDYDTADKLRRLGKKTKKLANNLNVFLDIRMGKDVLKDLRDGRMPHQMMPHETGNLNWALKVLKDNPGLLGRRVVVEKFMDENVAAIWSEDGSTICLSSAIVGKRYQLLAQLVDVLDKDHASIYKALDKGLVTK